MRRAVVSILIQIGVVALVNGALALVAAGLPASRWNLVWMLGFPVLVALIANKTGKSRATMIVALTLWSVVAIIATAALFQISY